MDDEEIMETIEDDLESSGEDSLWSMAKDFYSRKTLMFAIILYVDSFIFIGLAIYSAIEFFRTDLIKSQIMYAAIFICCIQFLALMKILGWQMVHRNGLGKYFKRLETRIAQLDQTLKTK